jgi:dTDP-4-amino-4,6-dideoxygalactose transaminase
MPNLNAALGCAQMESINHFLDSKRKIASWYEEFFRDSEIRFVKEPKYTHSNYWLNAAVFSDAQECKNFLEFANKNNVNARAAWTPIHKLPMFKSDLKGSLTWTEYYAQRVANLPSSPLRIPNA